MLNDWEAIQHIKLLQDIAYKVWGDNCTFGEIIEVESMYPAFDLPVKLYGKYNVKLEYEASTVGIYILLSGRYVGLSRIISDVYKGFKSMYPENLEHNFRLLDRVLKQME